MKKNNKGLSLIELIVAIAILAVVVLPLLTAFVVSLKTNAKAKEKLRATEIAHNMMEGMEALTVKDIMTQLNYPSANFDLLANHDGLSSREMVEDGTTTFAEASKMEKVELVNLYPDLKERSKHIEAHIANFGGGSYEMLPANSGKYYFYLNNIPSDNKRTRFAAMVTIDSNTKITTTGTNKQKYNDFAVTDMASLNPKYDATNSDVITNAKLITDINLQTGLHMIEDDLKYLTRTATIVIEHPTAASKNSKVTVTYTYQCKDYPEVDGEGNPVMEGGAQKLVDFSFPADDFVNKEHYTVTMFDNTTAGATDDSYLRDVYLFYDPWYHSQADDILKRCDNIVIKNADNYDCTVKLIKQKSVNEALLGAYEQAYRIRVDVNETGSHKPAYTKIETNLGTNIADDESYTDAMAKNQAVYIFNGSMATGAALYNAADPDPANKPTSSTKLWVSTGFGLKEEKDRLYDVRVDIYENPADPAAASTQLSEIRANTLKPIVTFTGGLTD